MKSSELKKRHREAKRCIRACKQVLDGPKGKLPHVRMILARSIERWREVEADMGRRLAQRFKTDV